MTNCFVGRVLQFSTAIQYGIISIYNALKENIVDQCKFSWSTDNICWTNWCNYDNYINNCKNIETDFYLKILFYSDLSSVCINGTKTTCYAISLYNENIFLTNFCDSPNLFQPYNNLDCALLLQQQLADSIICMFGIPIYYFKVIPDANTLDYTFKEYSLHNVVDVKQIKLMIQDGQMPSSNYRLTEFDFDWETDWETELSKTQFATAFGDTVFPSKNDFIYIPMMKRMWQVNSAYDEKNEGLMWRSTTWKVSLVKYNDSTNINDDDFKDMIDNFIDLKYQSDIYPLESNEQHRQTGSDSISSPTHASLNKLNLEMNDATRKTCSLSGIFIDNYNTCNKNKIIGRNLYKMDVDTFITYQKGICGNQGTIMFFLYNNILIPEESMFLKFGSICMHLKNDTKESYLKIDDKKYSLANNESYLIIYRWDKKTYSTNTSIYKRNYKSNLPQYLIKPEMFYIDFNDPLVEEVNNYNNDFEIKKPQECKIMGPVSITNIKYYDKFLSKNDGLIESMKYITTDDRCIINDLARPITTGYGYEVR